MDKQLIIRLLEEQKKNLNSFISVLEDKQQALIANDYDLLSAKMNDEESLISRIQKTEKERYSVMSEFLGQANKSSDNKAVKISSFIDSTRSLWKNNELEIVNSLQSDLKELAGKADKLNERNRYLIENARSFIREIISAVVRAQNRSIIDRKI